MLNKVILMGRLTRDPELKNTNSGIPMCRFSVAVERRYADKMTGERTADFLDCTAFKGTAEFVSRYFTKGSMILVEGSIQNNNYTDNNGVKLENVPADKTYYMTLTQHGKYQVTYTVEEEDWVAKNTLSLVKSIFVIDEEAPQVKFTNTSKTTAKVGEVVVIPNYIFQDNISAKENITIVASVINPYGRVYYFKDGENAIKCLYAGEYKFIVMAMDEHGNTTTITHTVTVSAK